MSSTAAALWALARPRGAPFVMLLPWVGYGFAHWDRALLLQDPVGIAWLSAAWLALHVGTMWLNAALDRDVGAVLFGTAREVPPATPVAGYLALAAAVALAAPAGLVPVGCAVGCAALAVLYSHPRTAWKGHARLGPAVNVLGYAVLSPLAGWWLVDVSANPRTLATWALFGPWVLGCYFAAQILQEDEDRARGYQTLVAVRGERAVRTAARLCLGVGAVGFLALAAVGWFPRACLVAAPMYAVADRWLAGRPDGAAWSEAAFSRLLWFAWLLLGALVFEYARTSLSHLPVAGLATAAGLPPDRPVLPAAELARWERSHP